MEQWENQNTIYVRSFAPSPEYPELLERNDREVWRYAGFFGQDKDPSLESLLEEVWKEALPVLSYRICYLHIPLEWEDGMPVLPFSARSKNLATCLAGCTEAVLFAGTIGAKYDQLITRAQRLSPTKALFLQALGAERIEGLCNTFCDQMEAENADRGLVKTPRYSPGFGDLPLGVQRDFFRVLDISHKLGISLGDSLLMTPSKSVTAIFGLKKA
jgi:hypothetical protein